MESVDRTKAWRSRRRLAALATAAALAATACGGADSAVDSAATGTDSAAETSSSGDSSSDDDATATTQGDPSLLSGEFETLTGATFDLGSLEGEDVVLWFWAPW